MTARNQGYNGNLAPNGSTTFGFQVTRPNGDHVHGERLHLRFRVTLSP